MSKVRSWLNCDFQFGGQGEGCRNKRETSHETCNDLAYFSLGHNSNNNV